MVSSRRKFIKISALGLGGAAVSASAFNFLSGSTYLDELVYAKITENYKKTATYCEVCFWKCAGWIYSDENNNVKKIIGNEDDFQCYGRLCPRGTGGVGMYTDPDRLKTPLIRDIVNGEETFREASWEEALTLVASKMQAVKDTHGAESIALIKHGEPGGHFEHLLKSFGSDTVAEPAFAQCRGPREIGFKLTLGSWVGSPEPTDIQDTKCLVLIGSHLGENMHNTQVQEMSDAIDRGATIITVDPRFSTAASKSKFWLPIKPATDMALLLSWMHVLIYENLYDKEYVEAFGLGFDQLKDHVRTFTPEWAYGITTIKPEIIRKTAREMADAAPAVIVHPGRHVSWYGDDSQRARAVAILNALLGSWGRQGGFYFKEALKVPDFPQPAYPKPKWTWRELSAKYPYAEMGVTNEVIRQSIPAEDVTHPVKGWIVAGCNLPVAIPQKELLLKAIDSLDFMVVVDTMPMEVTGYADVVLPECTYLERWGSIRSSTGREPSLALRAPAVEPLYDSKPAWWIAKQLGEKLDLHEYFNFTDYSEVLDWQFKQVGTSLDEMLKIGVKNYPRKTGPLYINSNLDYKFPTKSGKIEFYSEELASIGQPPIPVYTPHPEPEKGFYRLNYGRAPMHTFSRTANNPNLNDLMSENCVWVNPKVAKIEGLNADQYVWLKNQDGVISTFPIKVRITERIRFDAVYMVHGFGHDNKKLSNAHGKGISDTEMVTKVSIDPLMGGTGMRGNFISFIIENPNKNI